MKNKFLKSFLIFLFICNTSLAEQFKFETSKIEILENGNLTYAENGKAFSLDGNLEIEAKKFELKRDLNLLSAFQGTAFLNLIIKK